ncbi:MAG TPA: J domain-containing protein [Candidatus Obscuribacterales bacterium]
MNWQPPPPPPRPQMPPPGGAGPAPGQAPSAQDAAKELSLYELLQVDRNAHTTIIRYAYRYLAAMYHPDNSETGDAEKFRIITEAWKTLSDETRRQAYDMTLLAQDASRPVAPKAKAAASEFGRDSLPKFERTNVSWNEIELRMAVLQVLLAARRKKPNQGGASGKMLMDVLQVEDVRDVEFALWYLREKEFIETGERVFMITAKGLDHLTEQLGKTQILDGKTQVEQKVDKVVGTSGLPATIPHGI